MGRKEGNADRHARAAPAAKAGTPRPDRVAEGEEAVELYTRQIGFNLTELERQVELLREACVRTGKLLREVE